ncbi:MAG TPA: hypothetical protein VMR48_00595 [Gaiellaceae bacterium]|nr:hypothetical protein [Gaiellaceae bacterium]
MTRDLERRRQIERWISWVRLIAVPFAVVEVGFVSSGSPPGYERWAWVVTGALAIGAGVIWLLARRELSSRRQTVLAYTALALDIAIVGAYVVIFYAWEPNTPIRQALSAGGGRRGPLRHRGRPRRSASAGPFPGFRGSAAGRPLRPRL